MSNAPNYHRWLRKAYWRLNEAVSLLLETDPGEIYAACQDSLFFDEYRDLIDTALRSEGRNFPVISNTKETLQGTEYAHVLPIHFLSWAKKLGCRIPVELRVILESSDRENSELGDVSSRVNSVKRRELLEKASEVGDNCKATTKKEKRQHEIQSAISALGYDSLKIPTGGKKQIKIKCLEQADLFTDSTFDKAWQEARRQGAVKMLEHDQFASH